MSDGFNLTDRARSALANCNAREVEFCRAYVKNAHVEGRTRIAAHVAGYCADKPDSPERDGALRTVGNRMLAKPHISECIAALQECVVAEACIDITWWLKENVDLYTTCKRMVPVYSMQGDHLYDKPLDAKAAGSALDRIGRHLGAYEKTEKTGIAEIIGDLLNTINGARDYSGE